MDYRKLLLILLSCFSLFLPIKTLAVPYDHIVFFGDSLTDNGNLYDHDFGVLPSSNTYYQGRFSNGPTWAEHVANYFHDDTNNNYAVGGETVYLHNPFAGYLPYSLTLSIDSYIAHTAFADRSRSLFMFWIGANDYLNGASDVDQTTTIVVNDIKDDIENLITSHDALNFIVITLPDLSKTPYATINNVKDNLFQLTMAHNSKLALAVAQLQMDHPSVKIRLVDAFQLFNRLLNDTASINNQYHTHISNTTNACWSGGYTLKRAQLEAQLKAHPMMLTAKTSNAPAIDSKSLATYIMNTPALAETYKVGQSYANNQAFKCGDPDSYVFWDKVHPTAVVHSIFAQMMIDSINAG